MATTKTAGDRKIVVYDDFSSGEFGLMSDFNAPRHSFTGTNVVRYINGGIGPRLEPQAMTITGLPSGTLRGMGTGSDNSGNPIVWFIVADRVYSFIANSTSSQAVRTYTTALSGGTPAYWVDGNAALGAGGTDGYITVFGDKVYHLNHSTGAVTAIAASPGGYCQCVYGDRMLVANVGSENNRIYYSLPNDFGASAWDMGASGQWFDVGDDTAIKALIPQRGGVSIAKGGLASSGLSPNRTQWYRLSGVPSVNESVQKVLDHAVPTEPSHAVLLGNGNVGFLSAFSAKPSVFTGASVASYRHLSFDTASAFTASGIPPLAQVLALRDESDWMVMAGTTIDSARSAYLLREGCWTKHTFSTAALASQAVSLPLGDLVIMAKSGPTFYQWQAYNQRPSFAADTYCAAPAAADVAFTLPEEWAENGESLAVRSITVDFKRYDTGYAVNNSFTVSVTPRRLSGNGDGSGGADGTAQSFAFSEDENEGSTSGVRDRRHYRTTLSWGNGFQVAFSNIYGVTIEKVFVEVETQPMRSI